MRLIEFASLLSAAPASAAAATLALTENVEVAVLSAIPPTIAATAALLVAWRNTRKTDALHVLVNSNLTEFKRAALEEGLAKGREEGLAQGRAEAVAAHVVSRAEAKSDREEGAAAALVVPPPAPKP